MHPLHPGFPAINRRWFLAQTAIIALAICGLVTGGCRVVDKTVRLPGKAVGALVSPRPIPAVDPGELQTQVLRFTDEFATKSVEGIDHYARRVGTEQGQAEALRWKLTAVSVALAIASGASPYVNLIDLASTSTLNRLRLEEAAAAPGGSAFEPWLEIQRALETNLWTATVQVLGPEQEQELRMAVVRWHESNPGMRRIFFFRPLEAPQGLAASKETSQRLESVFGLIGLDPMSGLDPAVREVTRSRLLGERAMFVLQRMPFLIRLQTEVLAHELVTRPDVSRVLTNVAEVGVGLNRIGQAAESASRTAAELPERFAVEREAILTALEHQQGSLKELAAELSTTLGAGDRMSTSLNTTLITFDLLMKRFGVGEPKSTGPNDTNGVPFRILDYAETADRLAIAARELDSLVKDVAISLDSEAFDRRARDLSEVIRQVRSDARGLLDRAAMLAAGLILMVFVCALIWRRRTGVGASRGG